MVEAGELSEPGGGSAEPLTRQLWAAIRGEHGKPLSWMEMKADGVYGPQWTHPHPAFDESGTRVVFTSDRDGHPQVYVVEVPDAG